MAHILVSQLWLMFFIFFAIVTLSQPPSLRVQSDSNSLDYDDAVAEEDDVESEDEDESDVGASSSEGESEGQESRMEPSETPEIEVVPREELKRKPKGSEEGTDGRTRLDQR